MIQLRPHQLANIEQMTLALAKHGCALDASETGTGKTLSFLGLCKKLNAKPGIVTRKAVIPSWVEAAKLIGVEPLFITNYEQLLSDNFPFVKKHRATLKRKKVNAKTGEEEDKLSETAVFESWDIPEKRVILAFDEAQALRSEQSFVSKAAISAARNFKTVLLSATPFQTPLECFTYGIALKLFPHLGFQRWLFNYGCKKNVFRGWDFIGDKKDAPGAEPGTNARKGQEHMREIHELIFPERGVRTTRDQIPGFPESQITSEAVDTGETDAITKLYLKELAAKETADHEKACRNVDPEFHYLVEVLPIVCDIRLRQKAELLKARAMADLALDAVAQGDSVALFVNFDATCNLLGRYLETRMIIRGAKSDGTDNFDRKRAVDDFQSNRSKIVIVNSAAGGAGLSLHDPVSRVPRTSIISPPFSAVLLRQIQGRVWRLGGGYSRQRLVFAAGTVEERVMRRVRARDHNLNVLLDSDLDVLNENEAPIEQTT